LLRPEEEHEKLTAPLESGSLDSQEEHFLNFKNVMAKIMG